MKVELLIISCLISVNAWTQDVIIKRNGDEIQAKVLTVSDSKIDYKKWSNQNGPIYTISKGDVFMIKYINGDKDVFNNNTQPTSQESSPTREKKISSKYIVKSPAANNAKLVRKYKPEIRITTKHSEKTSKWIFPVMAVTDSSILSTEDIEVSIVPVTVCDQDQIETYLLRYYIKIKNKTNNTIYIDRANTFRVYTDGTYTTYFDANQINITKGKSSNIGISLGGVASVLGIGGTAGTLANSTFIGGSSQNAVSRSYSQQRVLAIPPHTTANLSEYKQAHVKGKHYENISDAEFWGFYWFGQKGKIKKGECIHYDEDESPYKNQYYITYSSREDFSSYSTLNFKVYARYVIGECWHSVLQYKRDGLIKDIQKYIPDFWNNPNIIVGEANYISKP